jgi:FixJ family two-component response regulator
MPSLNPTVFVVDPDESVRAFLDTLIRQAGWAPETFASAGEFLARPRLLAPSCLLLEVDLPDLDGFELQRRIAADRRETPIIVMSGQGDVPRTVRAMKAGALEFLVKPVADEALLAAVGQGIVQSQAVLEQETEQLELRRRYASLSGREREVMAQVVAGRLNKQAGAALGISEITVKAHRGKVMRKMGADSLAELVTMAVELRIASVPNTRIPSVTSTRTRHGVIGLVGRGSPLPRVQTTAASYLRAARSA